VKDALIPEASNGSFKHSHTQDLDLKSHSKDCLVILVGQLGNQTHNEEITSLARGLSLHKYIT
jgi:hypothetical protein